MSTTREDALQQIRDICHANGLLACVAWADEEKQEIDSEMIYCSGDHAVQPPLIVQMLGRVSGVMQGQAKMLTLASLAKVEYGQREFVQKSMQGIFNRALKESAEQTAQDYELTFRYPAEGESP